LPAVLLLMVTLVFAAFARNRPSDAGVAEINGPSENDLAEHDKRLSGPQRGARGSVFFKMLGDPQVWAIAVGCAFSKIIRYSFLYWLPIYMTQKLRYSASEAGYTSSLFELVGFLGAILAGYFSDKFMHSRRLGVAAIMFWGLAFMCWIHPTLAATGRLGAAFGIALIGIMNFGPDTLLQGAASQDVGAKWGVGTASGFISGFGSIGQIFSPYLVAYIADKFGWDRLFYGFVAIAFVGGVLLASQSGRETRQIDPRSSTTPSR
jgi:OPA family sugar phosphate sensor protein UhpC-like MFS transporter